MRVLQINTVCGVGSTGRIATDIHQILLEQGHESYIAYGRGEALNCSHAIKIGSKVDNYAHVMTTRIFDRHGFGSKKATKGFIRKVEALDPDIIHLHNIHGYFINIEILFNYLKRANKPVVWTLHDCWSFTGHCSHFDYIGCERWKSGCYNCPEKKEYPTSFLFDSSDLNYYKKKEIFTGVENLTIITPSIWLANLVKKSFLKDYYIKVINNGIDLSIFKPVENDFRKRFNLQNTFMILGAASVWTVRKGFEYFFELSKALGKDEKIVLIGVTEEQKKDLPLNIIGITHTNNIQELAEIYSSADVLVNPTLEDNFPTTNLESLACGTPVITFNTGGCVESIDSKTGIVVKEKDIKELLNQLLKVKSKEVVFQVKDLVEKTQIHYEKKANYLKYIDLYISKSNIF